MSPARIGACQGPYGQLWVTKSRPICWPFRGKRGQARREIVPRLSRWSQGGNDNNWQSPSPVLGAPDQSASLCFRIGRFPCAQDHDGQFLGERRQDPGTMVIPGSRHGSGSPWPALNHTGALKCSLTFLVTARDKRGERFAVVADAMVRDQVMPWDGSGTPPRSWWTSACWCWSSKAVAAPAT